MEEAVFVDIKMGVRTFEVAEVLGEKRRLDLLQKALIIQENNPAVEITADEMANGITKYRFMSLRDAASSSATLGFRFQGMRKGPRILKSKDFATICNRADCLSVFRSFFEGCTEAQRHGLLGQLKGLHAAADGSEWFHSQEFIGSSLFIVYDSAHPTRCGLWMIDFARTRPAPEPLRHTVPWALPSHEDGYLLGIASVIALWEDVFAGPAAEPTAA
eukprot:TRINITY_DN2321_c0_g1_i1.p4 TRINITY_DN2321_c0_g1~~TRINITY_DN2321_c0_g1_i1.p4  ORF type:complete len:217 (-),score=104.97 TRINITY_DN2321_c0_g1_i1:61-711(-)